ncbi:MAG: NAD-dependent epimerase/dehydratase family protein [Bacteroidetes bacterium]|nr:NAD-dependent epimerase/dehydratase family protein [Bacteroidota bacterium]
MAKILITGGAGFIGSHLVKNLVRNKHEVIVLDSLLRGNKIDQNVLSDITFVKDDVRNFEVVKKLSNQCDYIYHFAAVLGVDVVADNPIETMDTEVIGMKNVVDAALLNNVKKIIYASTSGIYGHSAIEKSVTENIQVDPRTSYAMAKRYNEIYLKAAHEQKGLNSISVRFFNVYGAGQDNRMVIPRFFEQCISGEPITVFGNGHQTRDFTYIDDTIKACLLLTEKVNGCEIFNVANENEFSILELAKLIKEITGSKSEIKIINSPSKRYDYEVERRFGSSDKLFKAVNFKPSTNLNEGLVKIFNSIK